MFNKKIMLILLVMLVGILTVSSVGAADLNTTNNQAITGEATDDNVIFQENSNALVTNDGYNATLSHMEDGTYVLESNGYYTFTDIQNAIDTMDPGMKLNIVGEFYGFGNDMIKIDKAITIYSAGTATLRANTNSNVKCGIFEITSSNVVLDNLILIGGSNQWGGAVNMKQTATTNFYEISNCQFIDNVADGNYGYGGAICTFGNYGVISNCTFTNNHCSDYGGAVYINGKNSRIIDCVFDHNYVSNPLSNWQGGGAIYNDCANLIMDNCTFNSNHASTAVGGALRVAATATIKNSIFKGNVANKGNAIFCENGDCVFTANRFVIASGESVDDVFYGRSVEDLVNSGNIIDTGKLNSSVRFTSESLIMDYGATGVIYAIVEGGQIGNVKVLNSNPTINVVGNQISIKGLDIGSYVLQVEAVPDENHYSSVGTVNITVRKATAKINVKAFTTYYKSTKKWSIGLRDTSSNKVLANVKIILRVCTNGNWKVYTATTNSNGVATFDTSKLSVGTHKVIISYSNSKYNCQAVTTTIKVNKMTLYYFITSNSYDDGSKIEVRVKDKSSNYYPNGVKIKLVIYTGSRISKTIVLVTGKYGNKQAYVAYGTNMLSAGTHNVKVLSADNKYYLNANSKLIIKKSATTKKKTYMMITNGKRIVR